MRRTAHNPIANLPSADVLRRKLAETERSAARLRAALEVVERIEATDESRDREEGVADAPR